MEREGSAAARIPCLDGLRALSITIVVVWHASLWSASVRGLLRLAPFTGTTGVALFFVISGYLITTLLLAERRNTGRINLRHFYVRRALRIFPGFYCFMAFVLLLWTVGLIHLHPLDFLAAGTYWQNLYHGATDQILQHTWSLAVEEQFYCLWPCVVAFSSRRGATCAAISGIVTLLIYRILRYGLACGANAYDALESAALDTVLYGCLLALLADVDRPCTWLTGAGQSSTAFWLTIGTLYGVYLLAPNWPCQLGFLLPMLRNFALTSLLWWSIRNPGTAWGRFLEATPIAAIGTLSYSLYLWQQPFFGTIGGHRLEWPADALVPLLPALLSYRLIERPMNRIRHRWASV